MRHLDTERWFYRQPNGKLRMKRVGAKGEEQFPRRYREVYQKAQNERGSGAVQLVAALRDELKGNLDSAWSAVKKMFNREV